MPLAIKIQTQSGAIMFSQTDAMLNQQIQHNEAQLHINPTQALADTPTQTPSSIREI